MYYTPEYLYYTSRVVVVGHLLLFCAGTTRNGAEEGERVEGGGGVESANRPRIG